MNCKPGDLAIVIGHEGDFDIGCLGRIVEVLGIGDDWSDEGDSRHHWLCVDVSRRLMPWQSPNGDCGFSLTADIPDSDLLPIRDQPGEDETLRWAELPTKEHA